MKMNKKGFTLAELLIVIAIIAILIAIAIPAFSGALESAKIQTDHANMRNAYAVAQTANLLGTIDVTTGTTTTTSPVNTDNEYYFKKDGTLNTTSDAKDYKTQVTVSDATKCSESIVCQTATHTENQSIFIDYDATNTKWVVCVGTPVGP